MLRSTLRSLRLRYLIWQLRRGETRIQQIVAKMRQYEQEEGFWRSSVWDEQHFA